MESELLFGFYDIFALDYKVLIAVKFFLSTIFFRKGFPMAGVDGAIFRVDFLIVSPCIASVFFV